LIGGFLTIADVLKLDGSILIWVFPSLMFCYGVARWRVTRHYGVDMSCEGETIIRKCLYFVLAGGVLLLMAWLERSALDAIRLGFLCGAGGGLVALGVVRGMAHWRQRRRAHD
jgi:hypothetical protein